MRALVHCRRKLSQPALGEALRPAHHLAGPWFATRDRSIAGACATLTDMHQPSGPEFANPFTEWVRTHPVTQWLLRHPRLAFGVFAAIAVVGGCVVVNELTALFTDDPLVPGMIATLRAAEVSWLRVLGWVAVGVIAVYFGWLARCVCAYTKRARVPGITQPHPDTGSLDYFEVLVPASNRFREMFAADVSRLMAAMQTLVSFNVEAFAHQGPERRGRAKLNATHHAAITGFGSAPRRMAAETDDLRGAAAVFGRSLVARVEYDLAESATSADELERFVHLSMTLKYTCDMLVLISKQLGELIASGLLSSKRRRLTTMLSELQTAIEARAVIYDALGRDVEQAVGLVVAFPEYRRAASA